MPVLERQDPLAPTRIEMGGCKFDFDACRSLWRRWAIPPSPPGVTGMCASSAPVRNTRPCRSTGGAILSMVADNFWDYSDRR